MPFWYQTKSPAVSDWSKAGSMRCILVWIWVLLDQGEHHCLDVHPCIGPCPGEVAHCCFGSALGCAVKGMKPTPAPLAWCGVAGGAELGVWQCPNLWGLLWGRPASEQQRAQDVLLICSLVQRDLQSLHGG